MKTISDLTHEIKAKIPEYISKAKDDLYSGVEAENWKKEDTVVYVNKIYEYCNLKLPVIIVANNPKEYKKFFNHIFNEAENEKYVNIIDELFNKKNETGERYVEGGIEEMFRNEPDVKNEIPAKHDYLFISSEYARVYLMWYRFLHKEFDIPFSKSDDLEWFYNHINKASISRCYYTDKVCLVLRMPSKIIRNDIGFHSTDGPAIQFVGGYGVYYLNGRRIPNWVFEKYENKTLKLEDLTKEKNEDIKAGIITLIKEREGNEGLMKFLNAVIVNEKEIKHKNGYTEILKLWKTKKKFTFLVDRNGITNQPYAWIEMICPSTGQTYLIDTCPSFTDVLECAKWHRPKLVPNSVPYVWQSAN